MLEKVCTGHHCQGQLRLLTEFYVHKSGIRKGKPFSRCKQCWRYQVTHPQGSLRDRVPVGEFRVVLDELVRRVGQTNAARRIGVAADTLSRRRLAEKESVRQETFLKAQAVLEEARVNGEDGWDYDAIRIGNLRPQEGGYARWRIERERQAAKERRAWQEEWEFEMVIDAMTSADSWAKTDKEGRLRPFADFECEHGRLSGDKTAPCGCWPSEGLTS